MKSPKYYINLTENEKSAVVQSLIKLKNALISQGKYTDAVDDVIIKIVQAKKRKFTVHYN